MDKIAYILAQPEFWFSSVLVGLIVGLITTFLSDWLKQQWGKVSKRQADRNARERQRIDEEARRCIATPLRVVAAQGKVFDMQSSIQAAFIFAVIFIVLAGFMSANQGEIAILFMVATALSQFSPESFANALSQWAVMRHFFIWGYVLFMLLGFAALLRGGMLQTKSIFWRKVIQRVGELATETTATSVHTEDSTDSHTTTATDTGK